MTITNKAAAQTVMARCDLLASFSEEAGCITRRFASPPMHQVHAVITSWMRDIDMHVEIDAMGNLIGRYAGSQRGAKTLLLGSHLDTVRNAGKYDGLLGVMVALASLENLHAQGKRLPFSIELIGFADEEGLRYQSVYIGSKAITGTFDPRDLTLRDADDISFADAIRNFGGNPDPTVLTTPRWRREELLGYCEVHIEQGPVLEARDLPLAVVSGIVGQQRILFTLQGEPGHAGTLPMDLRHDALCAAAEFVLAAEKIGRDVPGLVATVGQLQVQPGAANVVPSLINLSLDIRHEDDSLRNACATRLCQQAQQICEKRGISLSVQPVQNSQTVPCSPRLVQLWQQALAAEDYPVFTLPSGAGHDTVIMSALTDVAMLFVRCHAGISHNPAESVQIEDVAAAITVLDRYLQLTAKEQE
ncbi:MAG TPA: allantoate amidohydrolase [Ktedonobacteraceae bacterium]